MHGPRGHTPHPYGPDRRPPGSGAGVRGEEGASVSRPLTRRCGAFGQRARPGLSVPRISRSATDDGELSHRLFIAYQRESTIAYATSNARVTLSHNSNRHLAAIVENVRLVKPVSQVRILSGAKACIRRSDAVF